MCYNDPVMRNLRKLAREIANENKEYIRRSTDNQECACEEIFEILLVRTGRAIGELSSEELEDYHEAAFWGYQSIENFLEYLVD